MPLERFIPIKPYSVTIRPNGCFSFNTSASRYLDQLGAKRVALFADHETKQVRIEPSADDIKPRSRSSAPTASRERPWKAPHCCSGLVITPTVLNALLLPLTLTTR